MPEKEPPKPLAPFPWLIKTDQANTEVKKPEEPSFMVLFRTNVFRCSFPGEPAGLAASEKPSEQLEQQPIEDGGMQTPDSIVAKRWGGVLYTPLPPPEPSEGNPRA